MEVRGHGNAEEEQLLGPGPALTRPTSKLSVSFELGPHKSNIGADSGVCCTPFNLARHGSSILVGGTVSRTSDLRPTSLCFLMAHGMASSNHVRGCERALHCLLKKKHGWELMLLMVVEIRFLSYPGVGGGGGNAVNRMVGSGLQVRMRCDILHARPHILQRTKDEDIIVL